MKQLSHLLKHDFVMLQRNNIIGISIIVSAIYVAVFKLLSGLGDVEKLLVLIIFNDPALLGFLFIGVLVLFEKNENTVEALAVSPVKMTNYILSKTISLTVVALFCCYAMAIAGYGLQFNTLQFGLATILTSFIFSFLGFVVVAGQSSFNRYILRATGIIVFLSAPFLGYFELVPKQWFILFPTYPAIELYSFSFSNNAGLIDFVMNYALAIAWCLITFRWALVQINRNFKK